MCRTIAFTHPTPIGVLMLLALCVGMAHSFSWDIVLAKTSVLEFYNEGKVTYSVSPTSNAIHWMTYDPFHKRILFTETTSVQKIFSLDIETQKTETLLKIKYFWHIVTYDPATELLFMDTQIKNNIILSFPAKPGIDGSVAIEGKPVVYLEKAIKNLAVDSCRGYIYWISADTYIIKRATLNGTDPKDIIHENHDDTTRTALSIDPQTQKMYWIEENKVHEKFFVMSAGTDGKNIRILYSEDIKKDKSYSLGPTQVSKDSIYWGNILDKYFWKLPKDLPDGADVKPTAIEITNGSYSNMATNYTIEEQSQGNSDCKPLETLVLNNSATNDTGSLNDTTDVSLPRANETKVTAGSPGSGERCNVSVCHNYCLHGDCSTSADGQPKCRCNAGYSGEQCEVYACQMYCLNDGICSISDSGDPKCSCTEKYEGDRCDASIFLRKFFQAFTNITESLLNEVTKDSKSSTGI